MASRWADAESDKAEELRRKKEKEEKKRLKLQKQQQDAQAQAQAQAETETATSALAAQHSDSRPSKRRRLSNDHSDKKDEYMYPHTTSPPQPATRTLLRFTTRPWTPCRAPSTYEILNPIEEGSYGWVSRARDVSTSRIVALKKVKMDSSSTDGFPITALREISILQRARHPNIVSLIEVLAPAATTDAAAAAAADATDCVLALEFAEHDVRALLRDMHAPFLGSEVKTLLRQLCAGVAFLHDSGILHRDLKTSNLLLDNRGVLRIADFGMARYVPPAGAGADADAPPLTQLVVTLWYRAPELLLGAAAYGTGVDMWSVGCVFAELLLQQPVLQGKNEVDQLARIFALAGVPSEESWPGFSRLPHARSLRLPRAQVPQGGATRGFDRARFPSLTRAGVELLAGLLSLDPAQRPAAKQVLEHDYFKEQPKPKPVEMFPTFPSRAGQERRRRQSPDAPKRNERGKGGPADGLDFSSIFAAGAGAGVRGEDGDKGAGFMLKLT
ncbi:hypothetical protein ACN47E_001276 [Coniothyrium glycines]